MTTIVRPQIKVRTVDGWLDCSVPLAVQQPDDDPGSWQTAFDSRNFSTLATFYAGITGHDSGLTYTTINGNWTITDAWLATNNGNGNVSFVDGRWLVERYHVLGIARINANNVTLRNIYVDGTNGILYGFQSQTNATNLIIEHSTADGKMVSGSTAINFPAAIEPDQVQLRFCDFTGFRAGIYCFGGVTAEYCWSHDLHYTFESHNTGASVRARNCTIRRCLISDGNSAAISCYAENSPYTGVLLQENALRLPEADTGPEVIMAKQYSVPQPGETRRLIGNLFYRGNLGGDTFGFTEISGNIDSSGNPVTA